MTTTQQRTAALTKANQYRMVQAEFKRSLRVVSMEEGKRVACDVIREPAPEFGAMKVEALLRAIRAVGQDKAWAVCRHSNVLPSRRLANLTPGERSRLENVLS